jgi:hypothetical protein
LSSGVSTFVLAILAAIITFASAELLISRFHLYRFGIEEALLASAALAIGVAAGELSNMALGTGYEEFELASAFGMAAIAAFLIYSRFGYIYAAIAGIACALAGLWQFTPTLEMFRLIAAGTLTVAFLVVRSRPAVDDEVAEHNSTVLKAAIWGGLYVAIWGGLYVAVHVELFGSTFQGATLLYVASFLMIWVAPAIGLWMSLRDRNRWLMGVSLASGLCTLATAKLFFGLQPQAWDAILFGLALMGASVAIRRWLISGPEGQRHGFTAARLLSRDRSLVDLAANLSAAVQRDVSSEPERMSSKPDFGGGRSGGAGATGSF